MRRFYRTNKPFSKLSLGEVIDEMDLPYKNEPDRGFLYEHPYDLGFEDGKQHEVLRQKRRPYEKDLQISP